MTTQNIRRNLVDFLLNTEVLQLFTRYKTMNGTIKSIVFEKHFGFITPEDASKDVFFHETGLQEGIQFSELKNGDAVSFDVEQTEKGPRATNVARA